MNYPASAFVLLLAAAALVAAACGSDDAKRAREAQGGETNAGAGGNPTDAGESAGGSSEPGMAGQPAEGGTDSGQGGVGQEVATLAAFGLLFSVAPGAQGVPATGVAESAPEAASNLYTSTGSGATHVEGTNALGYTAADLGIDAGDDIDAVSVIHPATASAFYFSVTDEAAHDEGVDGTGVRRSSTDGEVKSDIFVSYALAPLNGNGSNIEWVDEYRLGLNPETAGDAAEDNLNALDIGVAPGTVPVFFSVNPDAVGALDSAVSTVAAAELGCTIFSSDLEGTNEVAFSCAQLGLAAGDDIDALVVLGVGAQPQTLLFSVTPGSVGLAATGVAAQAGQAAADVFASDGTGDNVVYIEERSLGLLADDDLDALAIETASDPGGTWLPPPPEDPPPPEPPPCPWEIARVRTNPGANDPVPHSAPAMGSGVATPSARIVRYSSIVRPLSAVDAARVNALQACGTSRLVTALPGSPASNLSVFCPAGAAELAPGLYFISVLETEEPFVAEDYQQAQIALIVDSDLAPGNNYAAMPPYDNDTFDNGDRVIQLQKNGASFVARAQDISDNSFQDLNGLADRVIIQGTRFILVMQVDEARAYPHRLTFYAADGQEWTMSNVNLVGEPMQTADLSSCL